MKSLSIPHEITWEITNLCKLKCKHCYQNATQNRLNNEFETSFILSYLDKLKKHGVIIIFWDGGDPLLHPDFMEILSIASQHFCCYISTNGTEIDNNYAKELKKANVSAIFISLYGATEKTHDEHTGVKDSFKKTINAIPYLQSNGINPIVTMILMKSNIQEIHQFVKLCNHLNVRQCNFLRFYAVGRGKDKAQELKPTYSQIQDFLAEISGIQSQIPVVHPFFPRLHNCCNIFFTITSTGETTPCSYLREKVRMGNIKENDLIDIWNKSDYVNLRSIKVNGKCKACDLYNDCGGGCRAAALEENRDWWSPDPSCGYQPLKKSEKLKIFRFL